MKQIIIILLMILNISCSKKSEIESIFIANKNEYWQYFNYCRNEGGIYFQFKKNGTYDKYLLYAKEGFSLFNNDGDIVSGPRPWSIKNDSTFIWDEWNYKIEKISEKEILISYYNYERLDKKCYIRFTKWLNTSKGPKLLDKPTPFKEEKE